MAVRVCEDGLYFSMAVMSIGIPSIACRLRHSCSVNLWIRLQTGKGLILTLHDVQVTHMPAGMHEPVQH